MEIGTYAYWGKNYGILILIGECLYYLISDEGFYLVFYPFE
jgi:hypothetical protein